MQHSKRTATRASRRPGRPVKIVQFHRAKGRYFAKLRLDGRIGYIYGDTEPEVLAEFNRRRDSAGRILVPITDERVKDELIELGVPEEVVESNPDLVERAKGLRFQINTNALERSPDAPVARLLLARLRGVEAPEPTPDEAAGPASSKRLSECFAAWKEWRESDGCTTHYIADVRRTFERFKKAIGNLAVAELNADTFSTWRLVVLRESKKRQSVKWARDQHMHVRMVLAFAESQHPNWGFPDGLTKWLDATKRLVGAPYVPKQQNRTPLPADVFARLLASCDEWASTTAGQFDRRSQRGRAQRLQAQCRQRCGVQWAAILRLAANCALDNVDCSRITPGSLKLAAPQPHMDFPRQKVRRRTGYAVPRLTPLLPATVAALRRWMEFEPVPTAPTLFRTARRRPYTQSRIGETFKRLKRAAGVEGEWTFKHIRNIGPSVRKAAALPSEMSDALLGHVTAGTSRFYEGDVGPEYLARLVDEIGRGYFAGGGADASAAKPPGASVVAPAAQ